MTAKLASGVARRMTFKAGNILGRWPTRDIYAVYSYGEHWVLALWTASLGWVLNSTRYPSPSTRRHQSRVEMAILRAGHTNAKCCSQEALKAMLAGEPTPAPQQPKITDKQLDLFDVSV